MTDTDIYNELKGTAGWGCSRKNVNSASYVAKANCQHFMQPRGSIDYSEGVCAILLAEKVTEALQNGSINPRDRVRVDNPYGGDVSITEQTSTLLFIDRELNGDVQHDGRYVGPDDCKRCPLNFTSSEARSRLETLRSAVSALDDGTNDTR